MKADTLKSLGFLKKSLKMNAKAMQNNELVAGASAADMGKVTAFMGLGVDMLKQIDEWEKAATVTVVTAPVPQPAPSTFVDPLAANDGSDLMVNP